MFLSLKPLARMGATVTGIDAVDKNVKIARLHAVRSLTYCITDYTNNLYTGCIVILMCNCVLSFLE